MTDQRSAAINAAYETLKASPPVTVAIGSLSGITFPTIVLFSTFVYTIILIYVTVRDKIYEPWAKRRRFSSQCQTCLQKIADSVTEDK